ncbi:hypothetical protein PF005_g3329 [Phytophthora fragariae]|uniref:Uncharacterized protein n=2 Tax=Phytophthora TaxID=4783 RepID=A0A6A3USC3_9STRA|nr:hypothetical protein PF003_g538 [Phytophthora fragariae]KAE9042184.1 hypothetical protein PR002_g4050 [Phytophthora rubi]KAE8948458.1 hypothetical protein PF009_g1979 [Phytophthora fragariae]KAE9047980.1 hypothetical protein PR001_g3996 [Phytophthora rubi]KAE9134676.1 hypothetical protein PF007_g2849 [Phytophthora fragariae]
MRTLNYSAKRPTLFAIVLVVSERRSLTLNSSKPAQNWHKTTSFSKLTGNSTPY